MSGFNEGSSHFSDFDMTYKPSLGEKLAWNKHKDKAKRDHTVIAKAFSQHKVSGIRTIFCGFADTGRNIYNIAKFTDGKNELWLTLEDVQSLIGNGLLYIYNGSDISNKNYYPNMNAYHGSEVTNFRSWKSQSFMG